MIILQKVYKADSAQNAPDARREISEERGVLSVRRSDEEIEATQQMEYFQRNHNRVFSIILNRTEFIGQYHYDQLQIGHITNGRKQA